MVFFKFWRMFSCCNSSIRIHCWYTIFIVTSLNEQSSLYKPRFKNAPYTSCNTDHNGSTDAWLRDNVFRKELHNVYMLTATLFKMFDNILNVSLIFGLIQVFEWLGKTIILLHHFNLLLLQYSQPHQVNSQFHYTHTGAFSHLSTL